MSEYAVRYSLLRRENDGCSTDTEEDIAEAFSHSSRPRKVHRCQTTFCKSYKTCSCFCISITVIVILTTCLLFGVVYSTMSTTSSETSDVDESSTVSESPSPRWTKELEATGITSPVRVVDVDGDGLLDLILAASYDSPIPSNTGKWSHGVMAMNGQNGQMLWRILTKDEVFELRCPVFDMDRDGVPDCIASGRHGTLIAFEFQHGTVLWSASLAINAAWNVLAPGVVQDVNGDGIQDMVVMNGGDSSYAPEQHNRTASHLLLLSGRTGKPVGEPFSMPDGKESYCLPVIFTSGDTSQYVLFGTGGETVSGALYMISLKHLLATVMPGVSHDLPGAYNHWKYREDSRIGLITLYETTTKGVMVPVSLADLNNDSVDDIISMTFDGVLLAFSGKDLTYLWQPWNFTLDRSQTESYTSPAFGFYNEDEVPDLMVQWQTGSWPAYDSLTIYVINGLNGELLWFKDTPIISDYSISSPLALTTSQPYRDAFIFRISSTNVPFSESSAQDDQQREEHDRISRRHFGTDENVILDRSNIQSPLLLYRQHSTPYYYNVTKELVEHRLAYLNSEEGSEHEVGRRHLIKEDDYGDVLGTERCSRLTPHNIATGVLADLDGDGGVDYVSLDAFYTKLSVRDNEPTGDMVTKSIVQVFSLKDVLHLLPLVKLDEVVTVGAAPAVTALSNLTLGDYHSWPQQFGPEQNGRL
ncbi:protein FAM234B-like isoform X2 [Watersipora subatra]|uniref:protein FAM234B-like isoform X2 n=1 Tax=Watersipora subatra TaxID=2589382 RepID=UPI00355C66D6